MPTFSKSDTVEGIDTLFDEAGILRMLGRSKPEDVSPVSSLFWNSYWILLRMFKDSPALRKLGCTAHLWASIFYCARKRFKQRVQKVMWVETININEIEHYKKVNTICLETIWKHKRNLKFNKIHSWKALFSAGAFWVFLVGISHSSASWE